MIKKSLSTLMKRDVGNYFRGYFLSTTPSYMIITNILKTINLEEQ